MEGISTNINYKILLSNETFDKIRKYRQDLIENKVVAGIYLKEKIIEINLDSISIHNFIELLLSTKKPKIFAEHAVKCDGTDWTSLEFAILGDINVAMGVMAFDNGVWETHMSTAHSDPLDMELLFTPGIMLVTRTTGPNNPDYKEVVEDNKISQEKYNSLVERRLLPLLVYTNCEAENGKKAFVVLPGIGCGNFAGNFFGQLEKKLDRALQAMIEKHEFPNIMGIQLGLHCKEFKVKPKIINNIVYEVRGNGLPQLSAPEKYGKQYKDCRLYKVVAWDHVSLPGNDFFSHNTRGTDDGVAAAATNSMEVITGITGEYQQGKYIPPSKYRDWKHVVEIEGIKLIANESNVKIVTEDGKYLNF